MSGGRAIQLVEAGLWLRMSGDLEGARRLFEQALRLDPDCDRARELLGTKPAAAEELPEELQHIPSSNTNLFAVPLPRLFPESVAEVPDAPTDPFIPLSMVAPLAPPYTPPAPQTPRPLPSMSAATPLPPPRGTPLPSAPPQPPASRGGTPLPGRAPGTSQSRGGTPLPGGLAQPRGGTPLPAAPPSGRTPLPSSTPSSFSRGRTPLPSTTPSGKTPVPAGPKGRSSARGGTPLPAGPPLPPSPGLPGWAPPPASSSSAVPLPEPTHHSATVAPLEPPSMAASDDWWTDGVTTPAPPKDAWEVGRQQPTTLAPSEATESDALHLVAPLPASAGGTPLPAKMPSDPRHEAQMLLQRASELQELDDHSGARELLLQAQALDPEAPEVERALAESEQTLQALYESKLGKLSVIPRVRLRDDEVIWLNLDHRAGFILAQIDGSLSFDDLFSVSGMSRLDTARILVQLLEQRVIVR